MGLFFTGMQQVFIGFGSNQGDSVHLCLRAVSMLREHSAIAICKVSSLYYTEPEGLESQPWFVNGVIECTTELDPKRLLQVLQGIENNLGRVRQMRWGPRTMDLDILAYGDTVIHLAHLVIPHPRLHERRFVLAPLLEIAPDWVHPTLKASVSELFCNLPREGGSAIQLMEIK
jgi:2-amino-4-hydroxy-6-hydroxymethyldihydropteridine diphosphokinase